MRPISILIIFIFCGAIAGVFSTSFEQRTNVVAQLEEDLQFLEEDTAHAVEVNKYLAAHVKREVSIMCFRYNKGIEALCIVTNSPFDPKYDDSYRHAIHELNQIITDYESKNPDYKRELAGLDEYIQQLASFNPQLVEIMNSVNGDPMIKYYYENYEPNNPFNPPEWNF